MSKRTVTYKKKCANKQNTAQNAYIHRYSHTLDAHAQVVLTKKHVHTYTSKERITQTHVHTNEYSYLCINTHTCNTYTLVLHAYTQSSANRIVLVHGSTRIHTRVYANTLNGIHTCDPSAGSVLTDSK